MSTYSTGVYYGTALYSSNKVNIKNITQLYLGCEVRDGFEANGIFDEVELFFEDKSNADITAMFNATVAAIWSSHQLLAHLDSHLDGGNLFNEGVSTANWRIFKKKSSDLQYNLIETIPNNELVETTEYMDYEATNNINYDYAIEGVASNGAVSNKYEITNVSLDFDGIWVIDKNTGDLFQFQYDVPELTISFDEDRAEIKTFSKYPLIRRGVYKAKKGNLQCSVAEILNYSFVLSQVQQLENLEGRDNIIIKFDNGEIFKGDIYNISYTRHPETRQISTVKCDYIQTGDVT